MDEHGKCDKPSPLRNSKAVNQPFQSPLRSVLSPGGKIDANCNQPKYSKTRSSPYSRTLITPKTSTGLVCNPTKLLGKKIISQESNNKEKRHEEAKDQEASVDEADDLQKIRDRISLKKRELEHMKRELLYKKKHSSEDLINLTERWLRGSQEALAQFQKDASEHSGSNVKMTEILAQLGIPPKLVQYSIEDCDFM